MDNAAEYGREDNTKQFDTLEDISDFIEIRNTTLRGYIESLKESNENIVDLWDKTLRTIRAKGHEPPPLMLDEKQSEIIDRVGYDRGLCKKLGISYTRFDTEWKYVFGAIAKHYLNRALTS